MASRNTRDHQERTAGPNSPPNPHVYRVQDVDGRGPYKPGLSQRWADDEGPILPTIFQDFPDLRMPLGAHYGCAFRSMEKLLAWFTPRERQRLCALGYGIVAIVPNRIVAESPHQLVIQCRRALCYGVRRVPWPHLGNAEFGGSALEASPHLMSQQPREAK